MCEKYNIDDEVTDGFNVGVVLEVDERVHGQPDYLVDWIELGIQNWEEASMIDRYRP